MPRDYANTPKPKHPHSLPGWIWLLGGLFIGLFIALLFYIATATGTSPNNSISDSVNNLIDKFKDTREVRKTEKQAPPPPSETKDKPKFDFYTILPELEVVIPDHELADKQKTRADDKTVATKPDQTGDVRYMIQAGSFRNLEQADRLKARLALHGIEASIQTVKINNNDTWHRVRVGPMQDLNTLNQTRKRLHDNGIATMVVKEKS